MSHEENEENETEAIEVILDEESVVILERIASATERTAEAQEAMVSRLEELSELLKES